MEELGMTDREILSHIDHTNLNNTATFEEIKATIDEGVELGCRAICIAPHYIKQAVQYAGGRIGVGAAVGFPRGDQTTATKVFETEEAVRNGASDIDVVINLCEVKNGNYDFVLDELKQVRRACKGIVLKVIVETSELTEAEKIKMCQVVTDSGADYIKTSTGFSSGGATLEDIRLIKENIGPNLKIKASGGIKTREQAVAYLELGVDRIGTKFTRCFIRGE